jgi:hypothetical protein
MVDPAAHRHADKAGPERRPGPATRAFYCKAKIYRRGTVTKMAPASLQTGEPFPSWFVWQESLRLSGTEVEHGYRHDEKR